MNSDTYDIEQHGQPCTWRSVPEPSTVGITATGTNFFLHYRNSVKFSPSNDTSRHLRYTHRAQDNPIATQAGSWDVCMSNATIIFAETIRSLSNGGSVDVATGGSANTSTDPSISPIRALNDSALPQLLHATTCGSTAPGAHLLINTIAMKTTATGGRWLGLAMEAFYRWWVKNC